MIMVSIKVSSYNEAVLYKSSCTIITLKEFGHYNFLKYLLNLQGKFLEVHRVEVVHIVHKTKLIHTINQVLRIFFLCSQKGRFYYIPKLEFKRISWRE